METEVIFPRSGAHRDYALSRGPHEFIEDQAKRAPDVPALTMGSKQISYRELNSRSNRLAHFLRDRESVLRAWSACVSIDRSIRS